MSKLSQYKTKPLPYSEWGKEAKKAHASFFSVTSTNVGISH